MEIISIINPHLSQAFFVSQQCYIHELLLLITDSFVLMRGPKRMWKVRFNDSPGSPSSFKRPPNNTGEDWYHSPHSPSLRAQAGRGLSVYSFLCLLRRGTSPPCLPWGSEKLPEQRWAGLLCVTVILLTVLDVILGLGKAQRHLKQSGLPRLESLEWPRASKEAPKGQC